MIIIIKGTLLAGDLKDTSDVDVIFKFMHFVVVNCNFQDQHIVRRIALC